MRRAIEADTDPSVIANVGLVRHQSVPGLCRWAVVGLFACLLIPRGVELQLGTIMIDSARIVLTIFGLIALNHLFSGRVVLRATAADWFIGVHVGIITLSAVYHGKGSEGLEDAAATIIDMGLAYFVARVFIENIACYRYFVRVVLIIAAISAVFGVYEMFTGHSLIRAGWQAFFPKVEWVHLYKQRFGLYRAHVAFRAHILFGLYCTLAFALAVLLKPERLGMRRSTFGLCLALCIIGTVASLSSGPWLALGMCLALLAYGWFMRTVRERWMLLVAGVIGVFILLSIVSNRNPVVLTIDYLTLDVESGYIRLAMWESVSALMREYWLLGWGWTGDWPRVEWYTWSSVDSLYAVWLVESGIFAVLAILGFLAYCWYKLVLLFTRGHPLAPEAGGWLLCTISLFITALTVHIFGSMTFATYFVLGAGQTLVAQAHAHRAPLTGGYTTFTGLMQRTPR